MANAKHKIKTYTLMLPTHWACPLINGDETGLEDEDTQALEAFTADMVRTYGSCHCVDVSEDTEFMRWHDAAQYGVLACDVATFTFFA